MSMENQQKPPSPPAQGPASANNQHAQTPPPWHGPAERSVGKQYAQGSSPQHGVGPVPPGNQVMQGPPLMHGVGPVPANNQQVQGPPSMHGVGPVPGNQVMQGPPSMQGVGPVPGNQVMQGPPSMQGVGPVPPSKQPGQNVLAVPGQLQPPPEKTGVSRRNLLIGGALVGGSLAAVGGIALAVQSMSSDTNTTAQTQQPSGGTIREYWVQANSFYHNLVPTGLDGMMGMRFEASQSSYWAVGYVAYTPNWGKPLPGNDDIGPNTGIPGPIFRGSVGDIIRVHFRNNDTHYRYAHSMHPHGVLYTPANDGAWFVANEEPGSKVEFGQTYTYEWHVRPNSVGTWIYHDHGPMVTIDSNMLMEFGAELGMFGFLVLTDASTKPATKEFFTFLHDLYQADIAVLSQDFDCFNGSSYLGNTPTFTAKVGDTIRWHIGALGKEFHAFHLHGHRWSSNDQFVDVVMLGPSMATSFDFVADNPGKWLYHCHVTDHMMGGMVGMYVIEQ
jgi:FtsP/CotA-like multicopper oxidase with cupredoxin domain